MTNEVQVDELEIDREFEALELEGEATARQAEAAHAEIGQDSDSWIPGARIAIDVVDAKVCPNWELTAAEKSELTDSLARALDRYFPGAIAGFDTWHPLMQFLFVGSAIAVQRFDWKRGGFTPMHKTRTQDDDDSEPGRRSVDDGDGSEPIGENSLRFTPNPE